MDRIFKVGAVRIVEDETTRGMTSEQVKNLLKPMYPEVANATFVEREQDGQPVVEFIPQPGSKG